MLSKDDPRLTRYALGEMNDEERTAFEREMTDADRAEVAAIRALAGTLTAELKAEPVAAPQPARPPMTSLRKGRRSNRTHWILAAAASVAVVGLVGSLMLPSLNRARETSYAGGVRASQLYGVNAMPNETPKNEPRLDGKVASDLLTYPTDWPDLAARRPEGPGLSTKTRQLDASGAYEFKERAPATPPSNSPVAMPAIAGELRDRGVDAERLVAASDVVRAKASRPDQDDDAAVHRSVAGRGEMPTADSYAKIRENPFVDPRTTPLSTFGIDVDTASYANVRRFLTNNTLPPADAVRIEELINYFPTGDAPPTDGRPFATYAEVARCPWAPSHQLVRVALKAKEVAVDKRPPSNLVFLVDVSGSMNEPTKLPLVKRGLLRLVETLGEDDRVAIVVYAGSSGLALPSTNATNKDAIRAAIDKLEAGGSTNGGQGIELAYGVAQAQFIKGGANRVVLCTDGDFNVGVTDRGQLNAMIAEKAKAGVFLSVLGFGRGNLKDDTMEALADKGNGNYAYIDNDREAQKVLVEQASGTLLTVAKDVKIQIEFNPAAVRSYRLIGYENRVLAKEDFNNDLKDAGEIGAGHNVVALYEIEPAQGGGPGHFSAPAQDALKYQRAPAPVVDGNASELLTLKLRYKHPDAPLEQGTSELIERALPNSDRTIDQASPDFQFAAAVAGFGMLLRGSSARGDCSWPTIAALAKRGLGADAGGHRAEFLTLIDRAASLNK